MSTQNWWETRSLLRFQSPAILMSGPTMSGKTRLTFKILQNARGMFQIPPTQMIIAYGHHQPLFEEMEQSIENLILHHGLPTREDLDHWSESSKHTLLVIDDLINKVVDSEDALFLFCVAAHHKNITVILLTQNLYMPGKYARTISLNCQYIIMFRNIRDARQISNFGSQVYPGKSKFFNAAHNLATSVPYGYLVVDLTSSVDENYRLRTNVLPNEDIRVFVEKV